MLGILGEEFSLTYTLVLLALGLVAYFFLFKPAPPPPPIKVIPKAAETIKQPARQKPADVIPPDTVCCLLLLLSTHMIK